LRRGDEILLGVKRRGHGVGNYTGVGGKLDEGEAVEQALVRECREEISVIPMHFWKVAELNFLKRDGDSPWRIYHHVYLADEWEGGPKESEEIIPEWFKTHEIPYAGMWQDAEFWLPQVLAGSKIYGEFTYDEHEQLQAHSVEIVETLPGEATS
jgi:8-oxo-dGTP diphosphatase